MPPAFVAIIGTAESLSVRESRLRFISASRRWKTRHSSL